MAELLTNGAVFIHVPKCGGTWVREVIRELGLYRDRVGFKHSIPAHVNDILQYRPGQYARHWIFHPLVLPRHYRAAFKFAFVRNPLHWYESWWKFMAGNWKAWEPGRWHPQRPIDACGDDDFNQFLRNVLDTCPGYLTEMYRQYTEGVGYVGRVESLTEDLITALNASGATIDEQVVRDFKPVNVSTARLGKPDWDPAVLRAVIDAEAGCIDRFGYRASVESFAATVG